MRRLGHLALLVALVSCTSTASALWPFKQKRFTAEAFIDAGSLGLADIDGRVAAIGDWNGDQNSDLFVISGKGKTLKVYLWDRDTFGYSSEPAHSLSFNEEITNVVPGDFNHDGRLDLLVMTASSSSGTDGGWWGGSGKSTPRTGMVVALGSGDGGFGETWSLNKSVSAQPLVFDADGSLRPSLLGYQATSSGDELRMWYNNGTGLDTRTAPLLPADQVCTLADPHSSAFVDIDGDCLPDLVLHCQRARSNTRFIQIWLNRGESGFVLSKSYKLPSWSGQVTFADMNRDGSLDMIFPTCEKYTTATGLGTDCSINIAYNKQAGVCSSEASNYDQEGRLQCRGWGELCQSDTEFEYEFNIDSDYFTSIPLSSLFSDQVELLLSVPNEPHIPLPVRPGDFDVDGFPDLLIVVGNSTAAPPSGGIFGTGRSAGTQVRVLRNIACGGRGVAGCDSAKRGARGLIVGGGKGWDALDDIWDATGASWVDMDDDGSLDIMVQRNGDQSEGRVTFIQNNFYHDAFFLKAQVLNGACDGDCQPVDGGKKYSGLGVSYSGATFKFTVLDTGGHRRAQQVVQLPQTSYQALHSPHSFIGLGRTNNYVENLFVGTSLFPPGHTTNLESLIPNSVVIINPPSPSEASYDDGSDQAPPSSRLPPLLVKARSSEWRSELYLHPGDWVPWVAAAVVGTVLTLGMVVVWLGEKEKKEDETERRRALHAINFQAL